MLAVIAQLNDPDTHIPYDYRDGISPEVYEDWIKNWPIYDDDELDHLMDRLKMVCDDALEEGIHAVFTIVKIAGTPSKLIYNFPYQPMMSDLFEDSVEVFTGGEKITPFSPALLLTFRPGIGYAEQEDVQDGLLTSEELKASQLVAEMEVLDNAMEPVGTAPYGIQIIDLNDDYVIYRDGGFEYHRSEIVDDGFMVGELRIGLDECMRL